ncbi:2-methylene-furan-3-one reductase [Gracilariopsis chorda]|uniref:2-methylene-furan-3-one reductase n=1 Tax=Gracilariopsis chorda TaxID=448386 RepID=A0A2V3IJN8_9FLOR|nr:2-methylene-furan-3-one reductase [Gracilariopsis chorda]|eukprot:PXF42253.1 2-methylene-furan-3-one reductase [Gracilariopsis chorda]
MKAAQVKAFGLPSEVLNVSDSVDPPSAPIPDHVLIRVHAVSLSPSDYRMLTGAGDLIKKPPHNKWPYIPGGDLSGVVEQVAPNVTRFKPGDHVIGTWDAFGIGALAELAVVHQKFVELKPPKLSFLEAAAVADSAANALLAVEDARVKAGDRVLVLGGSGGVGTSLLQLLRRADVSHIVTTSTDKPLCKQLGADVVINYKEVDWWKAPEVTEQAFDVMIDCAEGSSAWRKALEHGIVKSRKEGGRFLAVVVNEWHIEIHNCWQMLSWFLPVVRRVIASRCLGSVSPTYTMMFPAPRGDSNRRLLDIVEEGGLKVVLDPESPHSFTTKGVHDAFDKMIARKGHGKIVVSIRDE